ncbi:TRAP-type C4-dicarboxylate transport system substrate-binding protein [Virgibacillus natechei]|uniref:TRAP-type C4-dicarboxylate transport system substrate-binding protein n=1 Tax=Virgibacillus natechei TaxID=1216297 RepID=A0ABS4IJZ6_9BACI|nr:TRAP transporter substrate-binding protein [Virgibacillus natechei]MBP1971235.1 TRAP-type C4-dicarboxylate transport system substrate-binding protein [Virgibacillus natechei]UZD12134.1 TRAP transporter substrate-binding protein [Virgibacillus natechei]
MTKYSWKKIPIIAIATIFILVLVACGGGTEETEGSTEEASSEESSTSGEVIDLTVSSFMPGPHPQHKDVIEPFLERVEEATDGRVTGTMYPANALGESDAQYDLAVTGVADMSMTLHGYTPGEFPLSSVTELPFMGENAVDGTRIFWDLHEQFPEIAEEHEGTKIAWIFKNDAAQLFSVDNPINNWEDLEGMRIRTPSPAGTELLEAYGAIPVSMPMGDVYEAMQRGVVDGALGPASTITNFQLGDVMNYITKGDFYTSSLMVVINESTWNRISPEDQEVIEELMDREMALLAGETYDKDGDGGWTAAEEAGIEINELSDEEIEEWAKPLESISEEWVEEMEGNDLPGQAIYEAAVESRDQGE